MRSVSRKRARLLRKRREIVERTEPQVCEWCHREPAVDTHELVNRSQLPGVAAMPDLMTPIGRNCHDWATTHPHDAIRRGMAIPYSTHQRQASYASALDGVASYGMRPAARTSVTVKYDDDALTWIDEQAALRNVDRSELLRRIVDATRRLHAGLPPPITDPHPTSLPPGAGRVRPSPKPSQGGRG